MADAVYDTIGKRYTAKRSTDPRIYAAIRNAMGDARRVINLGAGTGSYEPDDLDVVGVEPSATMITQRKESAPPVIQGIAEALPFADNSFDLALGVLTVHHWRDWQAGLAEAARVTGGNILLLTWFGDRGEFWLSDYFPEIIALDEDRFPPVVEYEQLFDKVEFIPVPIPHDCQDGFLYSYWRRPEAYLDPEVRNSISTFPYMKHIDEGVARLRADLESGQWQAKYGDMLAHDAYDHGYRLVRTYG